MTIDTEALKARVDPLEFVGQDVELRRIGNEHHGACPLACGGGDDRFWIKPDGRWACRQCKAAGADLISYILERDHCTFRDACETLARFAGITLGENSSSSLTSFRSQSELRKPTLRSSERSELRTPSLEWKDAALAVVESCVARLWTEVGARARSYLHGRGLTDETIRAARLGFAPEPVTIAEMYVPAGITIPWTRDGDVVLVKVRTRSNAQGQKYLAVRWADRKRANGDGGHPWVYLADDLAGHATLATTEGEFDALLLSQEAGELVDVVTLGSAGADWPEDARTLALGYGRVLLLLDGDEAGEAAAARLSETLATARHVPLPAGQDVTDFHIAGGSLRALVGPYTPRVLRQGDDL
jgi:DNA primase